MKFVGADGWITVVIKGNLLGGTRAGHSVLTEPIGSVLRFLHKFGSQKIGTDRFFSEVGTEKIRFRFFRFDSGYNRINRVTSTWAHEIKKNSPPPTRAAVRLLARCWRHHQSTTALVQALAAARRSGRRGDRRRPHPACWIRARRAETAVVIDAPSSSIRGRTPSIHRPHALPRLRAVDPPRPRAEDPPPPRPPAGRGRAPSRRGSATAAPSRGRVLPPSLRRVEGRERAARRGGAAPGGREGEWEGDGSAECGMGGWDWETGVGLGLGDRDSRTTRVSAQLGRCSNGLK